MNDSNEEPISPLIKAYIDQELKVLKGADNSSRRKRWRNSWRSASPITKATLILTCTVAVATVGYSIIAGFQLHEMSRTNDLTSQALVGSADTLNKTLEKMQKQIDAANTANENTARLVQANFIMWNLISGERGHINIAFKNIGKMSASDVAASGQMQVVSIGSGVVLVRQDITKQLGTVQPEGSPDRALWFDIPKYTNSDGIGTDSELSSYFKDKVVYIKIKLRYNGGFGKLQNQEFCKVIIADTSVNSNHNLYPEMPECGDAQYYIDLRKKQIVSEAGRN